MWWARRRASPHVDWRTVHELLKKAAVETEKIVDEFRAKMIAKLKARQ